MTNKWVLEEARILAEGKLAEAERQRDKAMTVMHEQGETIIGLRRQRDELVSALEEVEWIEDGWSQLVCGWCGARWVFGAKHRPDCQRQSALTSAKDSA